MDRRNKPPEDTTAIKLILCLLAVALVTINAINLNVILAVYWFLVALYWFVNALL